MVCVYMSVAEKHCTSKEKIRKTKTVGIMEYLGHAAGLGWCAPLKRGGHNY